MTRHLRPGVVGRAGVLGMIWVSIGCGTPRAERTTCPSIEVSVVADSAEDGTRSIPAPDGGQVRLTRAPLVTSADITEASASLTEGRYVLNITLTPERTAGVRLFSERNVGRTLAVLVDGKVVRTPTIRDPITGDGFLIGPLQQEEAERLAAAINTACGR